MEYSGERSAKTLTWHVLEQTVINMATPIVADGLLMKCCARKEMDIEMLNSTREFQSIICTNIEVDTQSCVQHCKRYNT